MKSLSLHLLAAISPFLFAGCSSEGDEITDVLNECASISKQAGSRSGVAAQADYVARAMQNVDVSDCPSDFRMAFQAHVNAWQQAVPALANDSAGNAFVEGFTAGVTGDASYLGQSAQRAEADYYQINGTYDHLTQIAAKYGARVPRSVVGE